MLVAPPPLWCLRAARSWPGWVPAALTAQSAGAAANAVPARHHHSLGGPSSQYGGPAGVIGGSPPSPRGQTRSRTIDTIRHQAKTAQSEPAAATKHDERSVYGGAGQRGQRAALPQRCSHGRRSDPVVSRSSEPRVMDNQYIPSPAAAALQALPSRTEWTIDCWVRNSLSPNSAKRSLPLGAATGGR